MFRRRGKSAEVVDPAEGADDGEAVPADAEPAQTALAGTGPWDLGDVPPDESGTALMRLDLGSLRVPARPDVDVRLETDAANSVMAVSLVAGPSALQVAAFAAPRREGIWAEVRAELLESLQAEGSEAVERDGPFGPELVAKVGSPEGRQNARFVGVDGPRWFLRGVFTGPAATDPAQAAVLEQGLRDVVVVRGGDPLPVRDPLPLSLPAEVIAGEGPDDGATEGDPPTVPGMPRRGPEISEIR